MDEEQQMRRRDWGWLKENRTPHEFFRNSSFLLLQNQTKTIHWKGLIKLLTSQPTLQKFNVHSECDQLEGKDSILIKTPNKVLL